MNILTDALPNTVEIDGIKHRINTDFRYGINFELLIQNGCRNVFQLLIPFFPDGLPRNIEKAFEETELFYCCGKLPKEGKKGNGNSKQPYSFDVDANAIYADFWNFYSIDLSQEGLHWWAFRALLEGLPDDSEFKQRIYYRTCDTKGMSKKEKDRILKIRASIEIKKENNSGKLTLAERNAQMLDYVNKRTKEAQKGGGE